MLRRYLLAIAVITVTLTAFQSAQAVETWQVRSGKTTFHLNTNLMDGLGLSVEAVQDQPLSPVDPFMEHPNWSFLILPQSDLTVRLNHEVPRGVTTGGLRHEGSLVFTDEATGARFTIEDLHIAFDSSDPSVRDRNSDTIPNDNPFTMRDTRGDAILQLTDSMLHTAEGNKLDIFYLNIRISELWAQKLGRLELSGLVIGLAQLQADIEYVSGTSYGDPPVARLGAGILDVKLGILDSIQQAGRTGTEVGLTMATTSCNVGTVDVPWLAPMNEDHPSIAMALYREMNGNLEQVGTSWMKHGFFALSSSQCTPCQNPSNGTFLGVGCSDTYGPGNNSDRRYLGPRDEWDPFAGTWECSDSHFQGGASDCVRGHSSSGHNGVEHRLVVDDSEMDLPGATYFYEAYYVVRDDEVRDNNWGWREVSMTLSSSTWFFSNQSALVEGPLINTWGEQRTDVPIVGDGKVILAVQTTDLGGGTWHYQYALLNYDSDREIRTFAIPVAGVSGVTNFTFHDPDEDAGNDWTPALGAGVLQWSTDTVLVDPDANALTFGEMYAFGFDADAAPTTVSATLGLFLPPAGQTVNADILGPTGGPAPVDVSVTTAASGPVAVHMNPDGSGNALNAAQDWDGVNGSTPTLVDATITVTLTQGGSPVVGHPANDIQLVSSAGGWSLCDGTNAADGPTDASGTATFSGNLSGGGFSAPGELLQVVVSGIAVGTVTYGGGGAGLDIRMNSADSNDDNAVDLIDVGVFAGDYAGYAFRSDFDWNNQHNLIDLGGLASALGASCAVALAQKPALTDGRIGIYFDAAGLKPGTSLEVGQEAIAYLLLTGAQAQRGVTAWEATLTSSSNVRIVDVMLPDGAMNLGDESNLLVGTGGMHKAAAGQSLVLATLRVSVTDESPAHLGLRSGIGAGDALPVVTDGYTLLSTQPSSGAVDLPVAFLNDEISANTVVAQTLNLRNQPNPFNPSTQILFNLPREGRAEVRIYNVGGRLVTTLGGSVMAAGTNALDWNGTDRGGSSVVSGQYFYKLFLDGQSYGPSKKMSLLK